MSFTTNPFKVVTFVKSFGGGYLWRCHSCGETSATSFTDDIAEAHEHYKGHLLAKHNLTEDSVKAWV